MDGLQHSLCELFSVYTIACFLKVKRKNRKVNHAQSERVPCGLYIPGSPGYTHILDSRVSRNIIHTLQVGVLGQFTSTFGSFTLS